MIARIPDDMADKDSDYENQPHERSTMQQEKAVNKAKQDKREAGLQSPGRARRRAAPAATASKKTRRTANTCTRRR